MRIARRPRLTYANVVSTMALFLALGGGAYAAATLPTKSVGTTQLRKAAVTRAKIKNNAVDGSKVADRSMTGADVKESTLTIVPSATHALGAAAMDKVTYKAVPSGVPAFTPSVQATAPCDTGQHVDRRQRQGQRSGQTPSSMKATRTARTTHGRCASGTPAVRRSDSPSSPSARTITTTG